MPPFKPSVPSQNKRMGIQIPAPVFNLEEDHLAANDSMLYQERNLTNAWLVLHTAYGRRVITDRKEWIFKNCKFNL